MKIKYKKLPNYMAAAAATNQWFRQRCAGLMSLNSSSLILCRFLRFSLCSFRAALSIDNVMSSGSTSAVWLLVSLICEFSCRRECSTWLEIESFSDYSVGAGCSREATTSEIISSYFYSSVISFYWASWLWSCSNCLLFSRSWASIFSLLCLIYLFCSW